MINEQLFVAFQPFKFCRGLDHQWIKEVNKTQCVYFLVNQIKDGTMGRKAEDVIGVNALFIDIDGTAEWNGTDGSIVYGRDKTHWHAYWPLVEGEDMKKWDRAQKALIKHFGSDPACSDRSRVMRAPGTVNHKDGLGKPIHSTWKHEDKKWTIDEVIGYYGLELEEEQVDAKTIHITMDGVSCPEHVEAELVMRAEAIDVEVGERYAKVRNWSAQALGAGMDSERVHEVATETLVRLGYEKETARKQASNAQTGTIEKIKEGKLHVDERLRPDMVFEDDGAEETLETEASQEQAKALGVENLTDSLAKAGDRYEWFKRNEGRVSALPAIELVRLRDQWPGGVREFDKITKPKEDAIDWEAFATDFLEGRSSPLIYADSVWYNWSGTHYQEVEVDWVQKEVSGRIERPTTGKVNNAYQQVKFAAFREVEDEPKGIPFLNGRLVDGKLVEHTPENGGRYVLGFEYDPEAKCPTWERCLSEWFPDVEDERKVLLRQWFNYILTGREDIEKIMMMIGVQRGGKGTTIKVMQYLLGDDNYSTPTMSSFASEFGLQGSIGKKVMFLSDAHLPTRDRSTIMDRLKSISGKDRLDVNRKNLPVAKGVRLGQLIIACNEMDDIKDESNALIDRYNVIKFTKSFLNKEDLGLKDRVLSELPGIFNWAMSCPKFGRFLEDTRGSEEKESMSLSANPVRSWALENLQEGEGGTDTDFLYGEFRQFCEENGITHVPHKNTFMKRVRGVFPDSKVKVKRSGKAVFKSLEGVIPLQGNPEKRNTKCNLEKFEEFSSEV